MSQMLALTIVLAILYIGDIVATRTKAWIPSVFVCAVLFLIGYWTFFPKDIVSIAGIGPVVATMLMYLLITNMGTLLSLKELKNQWKAIVISLAGIVGIIAILFTIGAMIFDLKTMIVAVPPLVGGVVAALVMSEGASAAGLEDLAVFAIVIYVIQGFAGYPITSIVLKREAKRLLKEHQQGKLHTISQVQEEENAATEQPKLLRKIPANYNTEYFKFFRLALVGLLAYGTSTVLAPIVTVNALVLCLVFGVLASTIGFLEKQPLQKANGFGFAIMGLMLFIFDGLKQATPEMLMRIIVPLVVSIVLAVVGMYIFSFIAGKILKVSPNLAFAVSLTALYGFPADYILTNEVVKSSTTDEKEREMLLSRMLPPMLVGGFISVTITSVILAGIFVNWL
ncbi:hypothetical protein MKX57_14465 [Lysinibacillus sp. FSL M8-0216]|uniref:Na+/glutamate symporter n=1 Tax=Lysinibacillus fusiformis TaxID=28031 RepID=A0A1H9KD21_9BACI|nr:MULTISPECIES: hypothetical protein [Lysinibacillus]MCG7436471.1 hypothetical protein [Lysinibacillus fusiformis]MED4076818.1 hypothetical protein [Lysinibacillus fusiformis]MED4669999.1 hypothetical protein [Lysinibacillus fusiformis]NOG26898.1 hypothetical protein [Lysinibacillus fusiformis]QAS56433.1 hypothetical protein LSP_08665 [Lysinibacillus sphaericus]